MSGVSPDAVLGAVVTCTLALGAALWKLATMLTEVRGQVRHNGGGSLKDYAKQGREDALAAREAAEAAREKAAILEARLTGFIVASNASSERAIERDGERLARLSKVQHDVTATRTALALHVYEAQLAQAAYQGLTGHDVPTFTSPDGSPLPHPHRRATDTDTDKGTA